MAWRQVFESDAFASIHAPAVALHEAGLTDTATMRWFDDACLSAAPAIEPAQIKRLRESLNVSQPVFARYLDTRESTVETWETGAEKPSGMALKLLAIVQKHGLRILTRNRALLPPPIPLAC